MDDCVFAVRMETLRELKELHGFDRERMIEEITNVFVEALDGALNELYPEDEE